MHDKDSSHVKDGFKTNLPQLEVKLQMTEPDSILCHKEYAN